jgi:hypothetical protein
VHLCALRASVVKNILRRRHREKYRESLRNTPCTSVPSVPLWLRIFHYGDTELDSEIHGEITLHAKYSVHLCALRASVVKNWVSEKPRILHQSDEHPQNKKEPAFRRLPFAIHSLHFVSYIAGLAGVELTFISRTQNHFPSRFWKHDM